jgi:hypothetical protein
MWARNEELKTAFVSDASSAARPAITRGAVNSLNATRRVATGGVEVYLHSFLTYVRDRGERSASRHDRFTPAERTSNTHRIVGCWAFRRRETLQPVAGIEPRVIQPVT